MAFTLPRFTTAQTITVSFIGLILVGALLLSLPWASAPGKSTSFVDALFTSTSAVCVTGLIVRDTPGDFSLFGQIVILLLIQAGGLGYMVLTTVVIFALGGKLSLQERSTLRESLNLQSGERLVRFTMNVFKLTLAFELTGAVILTLAFWADHGSRAPWLGLFHAVSAFNNAGFSLFPDNLIRYRSDLVVNLVITALIICGGLGFLVLSELLKVRRTLPLSLQARLVLVVSAVLCVGGMAAILALEWDNPFSLSPMPLDEKLLVAWFHSVTARTAGFNTIDMSTLQPTTLFIVMALMFIGASPGGTGGGVKTTTFSVTVAALWATIRGDDDTVIFRRRLSDTLVAQAFFICLISFLALNTVALLLMILEPYEILKILFESASAFGTVGLSAGHPGSVLSLAGHMEDDAKLLLVLLMIAGRVGPMTLAVALARRQSRARIRYPEGRVSIG
jgi:trk system potassium uptake protein TrkH